MTVTGVEEEPGRRERKKQRTREALIDAAFELFIEKGYEATTVEEIADKVDVSSRTFFRYFASKEEVALTVQEDQLQAMLAALTARPAEEPVATALRHAMVDTVRAAESGETVTFDLGRAQCLITMTANSPAMRARSFAHAQRKHTEMTRVIAERMGVDPDVDMRPHVAVAVATCTFQSLADIVAAQPDRFGSIAEAVDATMAIIEQGLNFPSAARIP